MPDRAAIAATARATLGRMSVIGVREWRLLARLLGEDEEIEAMVLSRRKGGGLVGSQRIIVATPDRLLLVEKGLVSGRERIEEYRWDEINGVRVHPPTRLELSLREGPVTLTFVQPARALGAMSDVIRRHLDPAVGEGVSTGDLLDLARTKLGRVLGFAAEDNVLALAQELEPSESVLELAWVADKPDGLLALTDRRLVFVPSGRVRTGDPVSILDAEMADLALDDDRTLTAGGHAWGPVGPEERVQALVQRLAARLPS